MKHIIPLFAVLAAASTGLACGHCPTRTRTSCPSPVLESHRTVYVPACGNCRWIPPSTHNPLYVIGSVVTAPFRLITGRELGQPDVVASRDFVTMSGGKLVTVTRARPTYDACGHLTGKTMVKSTRLEPVGERITTVKAIRTVPMRRPLMPVGERCPVERRLTPVGERTFASNTAIMPGSYQNMLPNQPVLWY